MGGACSAHGTEETDIEGFAGEPELRDRVKYQGTNGWGVIR